MGEVKNVRVIGKEYLCKIRHYKNGETKNILMKFVGDDDCYWKTSDDNSELNYDWNVTEVIDFQDLQSDLTRHKELLRKQCNHSQDLTDKLEKAVEALSGRHDGCNYLSYGFCNKCGIDVNQKALKEITGGKSNDTEV